MDKLQKADFFMNVVFPIVVGIGIYFLANYCTISGYARNQLPDALWAWSLFSCILIIWKRNINTFWISVAFVFCVGFELLQHFQIINGVGDYMDVIIYFLSGIIALLSNNFFLITFKYGYDKSN